MRLFLLSTQVPHSLCTDNDVITQITENGPHTQKSTLRQQRHIRSFLFSLFLLGTSQIQYTRRLMRTRRWVYMSNTHYLMAAHIRIPALKPAQICCCIAPHTGPLQRDGCISRGQMMALFSLYQAAGCPYPVLRLLMQLASF